MAEINIPTYHLILNLVIIILCFPQAPEAIYKCRIAQPHDGNLAIFRNHCFLFHSKASTWVGASLVCNQKGGNLVTIPDEATQSFLVSKMREFRWQTSWIGANDRRTEGQWVWTTGTSVSYSNWGSYYRRKRSLKDTLQNIQNSFNSLKNSARDTLLKIPNQMEDCAYVKLTDRGRWHDAPCFFNIFRFNYVCQFDMIQTLSTTSATISAGVSSVAPREESSVGLTTTSTTTQAVQAATLLPETNTVDLLTSSYPEKMSTEILQNQSPRSSLFTLLLSQTNKHTTWPMSGTSHTIQPKDKTTLPLVSHYQYPEDKSTTSVLSHTSHTIQQKDQTMWSVSRTSQTIQPKDQITWLMSQTVQPKYQTMWSVSGTSQTIQLKDQTMSLASHTVQSKDETNLPGDGRTSETDQSTDESSTRSIPLYSHITSSLPFVQSGQHLNKHTLVVTSSKMTSSLADLSSSGRTISNGEHKLVTSSSRITTEFPETEKPTGEIASKRTKAMNPLMNSLSQFTSLGRTASNGQHVTSSRIITELLEREKPTATMASKYTLVVKPSITLLSDVTSPGQTLSNEQHKHVITTSQIITEFLETEKPTEKITRKYTSAINPLITSRIRTHLPEREKPTEKWAGKRTPAMNPSITDLPERETPILKSTVSTEMLSRITIPDVSQVSERVEVGTETTSSVKEQHKKPSTTFQWESVYSPGNVATTAEDGFRHHVPLTTRTVLLNKTHKDSEFEKHKTLFTKEIGLSVGAVIALVLAIVLLVIIKRRRPSKEDVYDAMAFDNQFYGTSTSLRDSVTSLYSDVTYRDTPLYSNMTPSDTPLYTNVTPRIVINESST